MRKRIVLAGLVLLGGLASVAQTVNVAGEWRGIWTNPEGMVFSATMTLQTGKGCKSCAVVATERYGARLCGRCATRDRIHLRSLPLKWG